MAGSSLEDGVQKHQKVYSFLKRTLPQDRYEGVRLIEPCVIVTDGFNKTFQFAVLGDEMLYITENPPRSLKDIKIKLDLAYVTSVELVSWSRSFYCCLLRNLTLSAAICQLGLHTDEISLHRSLCDIFYPDPLVAQTFPSYVVVLRKQTSLT